MATKHQLDATVRTETGRQASRSLRRNEKVPAILYGANTPAQNLTLAHKDIVRSLNHESFFSQIITLTIKGKKHQVILKDLHRHPYKPKILHVDFLRISAKEKINVNVPLHFINENIAPGIKQGGGMLSRLMIDVEIQCLPADLPEFIEVDLSALELGHSLHLSELQLPKKVELVAFMHGDKEDHDLPVVSITSAKGGAETDEEETSAAVETPADANKDKK